MSYSFGRMSIKRLSTCHEDLQNVLLLAINRSRIDFGVSCGTRTPEEQFELYKVGRKQNNDESWELVGRKVTNIDGFKRKSKHNYSPSKAVDIYIYHPDYETRKKLIYDKCSLCYVTGIIISCSEELYSQGKIKHKIRSGANWDMDGIILYDQSFDDLPHFEIVG